MNHRRDWNPHYSVVSEEIKAPVSDTSKISESDVVTLLKSFQYHPVYKKYFITREGEVKIFVEEGTVVYNPQEGKAVLEVLKRRPFFFQINKIHLAQTGRLWIWISDTMAAFLLFVAISGIFLLKGKYGLKGRGWWLLAIGIAIPLTAIFLYVI